MGKAEVKKSINMKEPEISCNPIQKGSGLSPPSIYTTEDTVTRQAMRLYVGNIPFGCSEVEMIGFLNAQMHVCGFSQAQENPILACRINLYKNFAFLDFRTIEDTTQAMALDGINFKGRSLIIRRPHRYQPVPGMSEIPNSAVPGRCIPPHISPRQQAQADPSAVTQTQWNASQSGQSELQRTLDCENQTQNCDEKNQFKVQLGDISIRQSTEGLKYESNLMSEILKLANHCDYLSDISSSVMTKQEFLFGDCQSLKETSGDSEKDILNFYRQRVLTYTTAIRNKQNLESANIEKAERTAKFY